jgi:AcrR family transcriptional regulator
MSQPQRRKKSDLARDRILTEARRIFAEEGYERTTIRAIAASVPINPSLVIRYFGSKEELFAAVATLEFKTLPLVKLPKGRLGEALVRHVLDRWDDHQEGEALAAMTRASITNEAARERIVVQFQQQLSGLFGELGPVVAPAAPFIATQILGLTMARYIWRIPAVTRLTKEQVVLTVGKAVQRYLNDCLKGRN